MHKKYIKILINISIGFFIFFYIYKLNLVSISNSFKFNNYVVVALCLYFFSQILKSLRLYLIISNPNLSLIKVTYKYIIFNTISIVLPFKLGDLFRIAFFKKEFTNIQTSSIALILERVLDLFVLVIFIVLFENSRSLISSDLIAIIVAILLSILVLSIVFVQILEILQSNMINRLENKRSFFIYKYSGLILFAYEDIKQATKGKKLVLFVITFLIWFIEIIAISLIVNTNTNQILEVLPIGVFVLLSAILPSGPLGFGGIQLSAYWYNEISMLKFDPAYVWGQMMLMYIFGILLGSSIYLIGKRKGR